MIQISIFKRVLVPCLFIFVFLGCAAHSPSVTYYLLTPLERPAVTKDAPDDSRPVRIGVGPIVLPEYLKRPQIVYRQENNLVSIDEFDRWAEPLANNFTRVLTENLALLLNTDYVYPYPHKHKTKIDYYILIDIYRFNATPGPKAELIANCNVQSGEDRSLVYKKKFSISKNLSAGDAAETVSVLNDILSDFSLEIATAIESLSKGTENQPVPHTRTAKQADPSRAINREVEILQSWQGDYPVKRLNVLPEKQQALALGFINDAETFNSIWAVFKPGEDVPEIDFQANLVLFTRNTRFYNRISIGRVNLRDGVAEVLSMETMSALPIEDKVALSMAMVPRDDITGLKAGDMILKIPEP